MLEAYAPEGVDRILPEFKDDADVPEWVGIDAWETAFIVNKEVLQSKGIDTVPKSYQDLLDPKYEGLIAMSNPASSGTGLLTVNGVLALYGEDEGWEYLDQLDKNVAVYMHSGSQPAKSTAAGEYGIGVSFGYRCIKSAEEVGSDICEAVFPEEGSGWDMEANALIKKDSVKETSRKIPRLGYFRQYYAEICAESSYRSHRNRRQHTGGLFFQSVGSADGQHRF